VYSRAFMFLNKINADTPTLAEDEKLAAWGTDV